MHEVERAQWSLPERALWRRIEAYPFERADHALDFTRRLARDRGWSLDFARGAVAEYRRFCFLAMVSDSPVTPSEEVDEVWHQHLTYSRDYWEHWCAQALGRPLHHDPTAGGPIEQGCYRAQYAETLARYEAYFGAPDPAYWPGTAQRFRARPRYRIVDRDRVWLLPRPDWRGRLAGALALLLFTPQPASAQGLNPLDWTAGPFLVLYAILGLVTVFAAVMWRRKRVGGGTGRAAGGGFPTKEPGVIDLAMLAGGRERAADTIVVGWMKAGAARLQAPERSLLSTKNRIAIDDTAVSLPPELQPFRGAVRGTLGRDEIVAALKTRLDAVEAALVRRGLMPSPQAVRRLGLETLVIFAPVLVLGLARVVAGLSHGKPVGILIGMTAFLALVCFCMVAMKPHSTKAGDAALAACRARSQRAASAPRDHELLFAFALGGAAVLAGTELAAYGKLMQPSSGGGDSGSDSSDSDGGGDGGGGCGGGGGD